MKVLDTASTQYLLPIKNNEDLGKVGDKVYGTLEGFNKDTAVISFQGRTLTMPEGVLIGKEKGDQLTFEIQSISKNKISLKYIPEETIKSHPIKTSRVENTTFSGRNFIDLLEQIDSNDIEKGHFNGEVKEHIDQILSRVTREDLEKILEEGYNPDKIDIEALNKIISRIKEGGSFWSKKEPELSDKIQKYAHLTSNKEQLKAIISKLVQHNLPVNDYTLTKVMKGINKLNGVSQVNDQAIFHLLKNNEDMTIDNLYKAQHMNHSTSNHQEKVIDFEALHNQIIEIIKSAGLEVDEDTLQRARELISNEVPLTPSNLNKIQELKTLTKLEEDKKLDWIIGSMAKGKPITKASLIAHSSGSVEGNEIQDLIYTVSKIKDREIKYVLKQQMPLTIHELKKPREEQAEPVLTQLEEENYISAKRQMEEIRLRLTHDSALRLMKKGFKIETEHLEKVVNALREVEQEIHYQRMDEAGVGIKETNLHGLQETIDRVEEIKYFPLTSLGCLVKEALPQQLETLHKMGAEEKLNYEKAQTVYDTLMTTPRKDLGDSISKTYQQIHPILEELGMEITQSNERAIKVLAHHEMPLTEENILAVKTLDAKINHLIKEIHPAVIVQMIKEGKNPLALPLDDLMKEIEGIKSELGVTREEKYNAYIWQLEQNNELTPEERDGLIGIYRLLHGIDKSEGKAAAMLYKQDRTLNLKNLLEATRLLQAKEIDVTIDQDFGMLEALKREDKTITEQLDNAFSIEKQVDNDGNLKFMTMLINQLKDQLTPNKVMQLYPKVDIASMPVEELVEALLSIDEGGVEGTFEAMSHKLNDQLQKLQNVQQETLTFMKELQVPYTIKNILTTEILLQDPYLLQKAVKNIHHAMDKPNKNKIEKLLTGLFNIEDDEKLQEGLEQLHIGIENLHKEQLDANTPFDLIQSFEQMKSLLEIQKHFTKEGFYQVPIIVDGQITQLNVHYIKDNKNTTKKGFYCSIETETFGKIKAKVNFINKGIHMKISVEKMGSFKKYVGNIEENFKIAGYEVTSIEVEKMQGKTTNHVGKGMNSHYDKVI